ncbi:MAG: hypothetical protein GX020_03135 [Firmicutes bacterium]|nr:hypothetical protein [Bacillota bacterium]
MPKRKFFRLALVLVILVLAVGCFPGPSPYTVIGRVVDQNGNGIEGVEVRFSGTLITAYTNKNGYFQAQIRGPKIVTPYKPGYEFSPKQLSVNGEPETTVYLSEDFVGVFYTVNLEGYVYILENPQVLSLSEAADEYLISTESLPPSGYGPLVNAAVELKELGYNTYSAKTDYRGRFVFYDLPVGPKELTITHFQLRDPIHRTVNIKKGLNYVADQYAGVGFYIYIGIDEYLHDLDLPRINAAKNANEMQQALASGVLKGFDRILTNHQATKANIKAAIDDARRLAGPEDYLVIYFSGRVFNDPTIGLDYLVPFDGRDYGSKPDKTLITDGELEGWLRNFPGDVTVILDVDYSGSFIDGIVTYAPQSIEPLALRRSGYTVITSTQNDERNVYEPGSPFTRFVVEGLSTRKADSNWDREITAYELYNYVSNRMKSYFQGDLDAHTPKFHSYTPNTVILRYQ